MLFAPSCESVHLINIDVCCGTAEVDVISTEYKYKRNTSWIISTKLSVAIHSMQTKWEAFCASYSTIAKLTLTCELAR